VRKVDGQWLGPKRRKTWVSMGMVEGCLGAVWELEAGVFLAGPV